jgi:hypothetical protein
MIIIQTDWELVRTCRSIARRGKLKRLSEGKEDEERRCQHNVAEADSEICKAGVFKIPLKKDGDIG